MRLLAALLFLLLSAPVSAVNVKDYGAEGDGATDDFWAIQNAKAALPDEGGTIHFPPGVYLCSPRDRQSSCLNIERSNVRVRLSPGATLRLPANTVTSEADNARMLVFEHRYKALIQNVSVTGGTIDMNRGSGNDGNGSGSNYPNRVNAVRIGQNVKGASIRNVRLVNVSGDALRVLGSADRLAERIRVRGVEVLSSDEGFFIQGAADVVVSGNTLRDVDNARGGGVGGDCIEFVGAWQWLASGNVLRNCARSGFDVYGPTAVDGSIIGNVIHRVSGGTAGIDVAEGAKRVKISDNQMTGISDQIPGVRVAGSADPGWVRITDNAIEGGSHGVEVHPDTYQVDVQGNRISGSVGECIVHGGEDGTVLRNRCD